MKEYWRPDEICKKLNIHYNTLRRWIREGKIPSYRIGKQYRFDKSEIELWLADSIVATTRHIGGPR